MAVVLGNKVVAVLFVGLMITSAVTAYLTVQLMESKNVQPWQEPHNYSVTGILEGNDCSGTGRSEYASETNLDRIYNFTLSFANKDSSGKLKFGIAFNNDGTPKTELYTKVGETEIDGRTYTVWTFERDETTYTFQAGNDCIVREIRAASGMFSITATIKEAN